MWPLIVILNLHLVIASTDHLDGPRNKVVFAGQPMEMECWADSNSTISEWSMQKSFASNKKTIFVNTKDQQKIKNEHFGFVEGANGSIVLYKNSTEMDDAGIYICVVQKSLKQPDRYSAHLIVFEGEPRCETNLSTADNNTFEEGTLLWMRCTLNFTGSWTPTMEWRLHEDNGETDEEPKDLTDSANVEFVTNITLSSTLTIALNATSNPSYFSCKIYFPSVNNSELVTASNSPEYNHKWNSPLVASLPKPVVSTAHWIGMTTDDLSNNKHDAGSIFSVSNPIYLVAGIAVVFGIASSLVALILCLRLRRKNSAVMADIDRAEPSEYDLIPYAVTDGYDKIEEVDEIDDIILFPNFPPRHGPLPSPGYSSLKPDEPKPPGVYSRMEHKEKSSEDEKSDDDKKRLETDIDGTKPDHSKLSDVHVYEGRPTVRTTMRPNSYLDLTTEAVKDIEAEEIPSTYLTTTDTNVVVTSHNKDPNGYLQLLSKSDREMEEDNDEIPSAYLRMTVDQLQPVISSNIRIASLEDEIPSSYLTTREIDSSALQHSVL